MTSALVIHNIDLSNYVFEFENALADKQVRHQYFEFLKQEMNSELLLFVTEVAELEQLAKQAEKQQEAVALANHIMEA